MQHYVTEGLRDVGLRDEVEKGGFGLDDLKKGGGVE